MWLALAIAGCQEERSAVDDDEARASCDAPDVGIARLRRLTRAEYRNTIRDLLGLPAAIETFQPDDATHGYAANAVVPVTRVAVEDYQRSAESLAAAIDLVTLLPCNAADGSACARTFIEDFGPRAYRRPLESSEIDSLLALFEQEHAEAGFDAAARLVVEAMLMSPSFLYRVELGAGGDGSDVVPLTDYELASRLSYFLWASTPDDALLAAAAQGSLSDPAELEAQARRMLEDDKARDALVSFYEQWLELTELTSIQKDAGLYPEASPALLSAMYVETMVFIDAVMRGPDPSLRHLLTASYSYANATMAEHYGVTPPSNDPGAWLKVELPAGQRSGLLTHASVMTALAEPNQASPVLRGQFVRARLMCSPPPPPPADADITPPEVDPSLPTADRWAQHREDPACRGCHELMDPIGLGFSHYDAIGRWTTQDGEHPVDAGGEILHGGDLDGTFDGAVELGARLAESPQVHQCVARQWLRFALGRFEAEEDQCSLDAIDLAFADDELDLHELVVAIVTSDTFRYWRNDA